MSVACHAIGRIDQALEALECRPDLLSDEERRSLDERGFVLLPNLIDAAWLSELRAAWDELESKEGDRAGLDYHQEAGALRLGNLVNKGNGVFNRTWTHPKYLAALWHLLRGEFRLSSVSGRESRAGAEGRQQGLHPDYWGKSYVPGGPVLAVDSVWMLDDWTPDNGATRVVPGSHRWPMRPEDVMKNTSDDHPQQQVVAAPAGSVLVFNGHTWHSGTRNQSGARRRGIFPYMVAQSNGDGGKYQRAHLLKTVYDDLAPAARYLLGVE